jgi:gliding motility-associated-like protein
MRYMRLLLCVLLVWFSQFCVAQTVFSITQVGSDLCEGILYDSGGPNGLYGAGEDFTFVICPKTPTACIEFSIEYYHLEDGTTPFSGDFLSFYDGPNVLSPKIGPSLGGSRYGGGGVCYRIQAKSACLTVLFQSNATEQKDGFKAKWQCAAQPCDPPETLKINSNPPVDTILASVQTPFTQVKVANIKCPQGGMGTFRFATVDNDLGLGKGLILSTGLVSSAIGPNKREDTGTDSGGAGDADLDQISIKQGLNQVSKDACLVEFDVFATSDELRFEYIFASEEYPEWVNTSYNDIFAFLISGPGIVGDPMLGGALNIATLPNSGQTIQVNSVSPNTNWPYYRPNPVGAQFIEYDGFTSDSLGKKKTLTARAKVIPCNTYRLKLAIADRTDGKYDSSVFIADINGGTPVIGTDFTGGINFLREGCSASEQKIVFTQPDVLSKETKFYIKTEGTATRNSDYTSTLPDSIIFAPGETTKTYTINQLIDNIKENTETIVVYLSNNFGCGTVILDSLVIELRDLVVVDILTKDTLNLCQGVDFQLNVTGADTYSWSPPNGLNNPNIANPILKAQQTGWLKVTGKTDDCTDTDSIFVIVHQPEVSLTITGKDKICLGESAKLMIEYSPSNWPLTWVPTNSLSNTNTNMPVATPVISTTYKASLSFDNCTVVDSVRVTVNPTVLVEDIKATPASESELCEGMAITLSTKTNPLGAPLTWFVNGVLIPGQTLDSLKLKASGDSVLLHYSVKATNSFGCAINPDSVVYLVKRCFLFPNAFTPNGDGVNDSFGLVDFGGDFEVEEFKVYDRWGQLAFFGLPGEKRWDGQTNGRPSPPDVYTYVIQVIYADGEERMVTGTVMLLR